jgi:hypothetical protein
MLPRAIQLLELKSDRLLDCSFGLFEDYHDFSFNRKVHFALAQYERK